MKLYLKLIVGLAALATLSRALLAADVTIPYPIFRTNTSAPVNYSPASIATASSNAVVVGLNAQVVLLKELIQAHQKRSADLTQKSQSEKAKWETELVAELEEQRARLQKSIDQAAQPTGTERLKVDEQLVFVSTLEARLEQVRQELSAAVEDSRVLATQISTNNVAENVAGMSFALSDNQKIVKDLQREQLDLELRALEFRALCKVMQK
jgi:hypothetical protein